MISVTITPKPMTDDEIREHFCYEFTARTGLQVHELGPTIRGVIESLLASMIAQNHAVLAMMGYGSNPNNSSPWISDEDTKCPLTAPLDPKGKIPTSQLPTGINRTVLTDFTKEGTEKVDKLRSEQKSSQIYCDHTWAVYDSGFSRYKYCSKCDKKGDTL